MSNLVKPYKIAVYDDVLGTNGFEEKRLGIIGSDTMIGLNRALEPNLVRNVNGQNKFSFKMYKKYADSVTGEQVTNPFIDWLISERKIKLEYDGRWYDFIIKDINENSSNHLYTYQLEDANVQELSKNGFGITLDAALMNNIGTATELGARVMEQTDWSVDGDVTIQTIDEALVYVSIPANTTVKHIRDQIVDENGNYSRGVTLYDDIKFENATTVLAFYSSCKNKPYRFQFIYSPKGYIKDGSGNYVISRKDNHIIDEKDCQYYIDFDNPEATYVVHDTTYDLYLPQGWSVVAQGTGDSRDTTISSWYRGARYGYAQQAVYVPLLEQYCQKFKREETIAPDSEKIHLHHSGSGQTIYGYFADDYASFQGTKTSAYSGVKFVLNYDERDIYVVSYKLNIDFNSTNPLLTIGGHAHSFETLSYKIYKNEAKNELANYEYIGDNTYELKEVLDQVWVEAKYQYIKKADDGQPYIFIQPNRGNTGDITFTLSNINISTQGDCLGYTTSEFVSPTLIQNCITNYKFESASGWTITASTSTPSADKGDATNVYGRFDSGKFITITEDFLNGTYAESNTYIPYMKLLFKKNNQFVLNSSIYDNRSMIKNMPKDEEWVLDYKIVDSVGNPCSSNFEVSLGEYIYNTNTGGYNQRNGLISFSASQPDDFNDGKRVIFKVESTTYDADSFKKISKIHLKISPNSNITTDTSFYIEKIALYRKSLDKNSEIIYPDYEEEHSSAAAAWSDNSTLEHKYIYFNTWHIDGDNPNAYTEKDKIPTITKNTLEYSIFKPVYNEGAEKVRTVTAKESNYFNVLQSIAETFEQWLVIDIERETDGSIKPNGKKIHFRNYRGGDNYACFRYGVNLKDIQRTKSSKNIVTKLIVKQNSNELAENGFCTIQRAGANPTGENYIYDFQYHQNTGIMPADEYLTTNYYLDNAQGPDHSLWEDEIVANSDEYNINGYFPRLKKINDSILPINEEIIGLQADLVKRKAELEVAEATYEAATSGIEQTEEDFRTLTGVSPKEAQTGEIERIDEVVITSEDGWSIVDTGTITKNTQNISVTLNVVKTFVEEYCEIIADSETTLVKLTSGAKKITKKTPWTGLYIQNDWEDEQLHDEKDGNIYRTYKLTYELEWVDGNLINIGCHNSWFNTGFGISVTDESGNVIAQSSTDICSLPTSGDNAIKKNTKYLVTVIGTRNPGPPEPQFSKDLWIQPNRGEENGFIEVTCKISKIKLYKQLTSGEAAKSYDRTAHIRINAKIKLKDIETPIDRTFETACAFPADQTSIVVTQPVSVIDTTRSDVQKYLSEYTTYLEKLESSSLEKTNLTPIIVNKENSIKEKEAYRKQLLEYKTELNKLFFKRYSRFIQEGTWINEEYVDDEKYYADALSVLYNSCYPQVTYNINVLELSRLPGYELFLFEPGERTWVIDPEFFGEDYREEVIITELSEMLDDPSKNNVKVQNFKNQFQDLFQKITATVQQTQYNVGSYEKGGALVEASAAKKSEFITNAINAAQTYLNAGQTVKSGTDGITITDDSNAKRQLRLVGGAILFSAEDPKTKEARWRTGLTNEGISADLIKAGKIDTGEIQIMAGDQAAFRWDAYGISAYNALWNDSGGVSTVGNIDTNKFVRFDKHGIYGIDGTENGATWHPTGLAQIDEKATFALTWEGLKVTGNNSTEARLGKQENYIMTVKDQQGKDTFRIGNDGKVEIAGELLIGGNLESGSSITRVGRNLLRNTSSPTILDDVNNSYQGYCCTDFEPTILPLEKQKTYTFSADVEIIQSSSPPTQITIAFYNELINTTIAATNLDIINNHVSGTITGSNYTGSEEIKRFIIYAGLASGTRGNKVKFTNMKLEEGSQATTWSVAPEDPSLAPSVNTNDFSWKFSPNDGLYMYNGQQDEDNEVFKIYKPNSSNGYTAWIKGEIHAESGSIASWTLNRSGTMTTLYHRNKSGTNYIDSGTGMSSGSSTMGDPAFWAGYVGTGANPWLRESSDENWAANTKFFVDYNGNLYAQGEGKIAGWNFTNSGLYSANSDKYSGLNKTGAAFYAGASSTTPSADTANFYVDHSGNMTAKSGTFGNLTIGASNNNKYITFKYSDTIGSYTDFSAVGEIGAGFVLKSQINNTTNQATHQFSATSTQVSITSNGNTAILRSTSLDFGGDELIARDNKGLYLSTSTGDVYVSELVFKDACDIKYGDTVVGRIMQIGTVVYGALKPAFSSDITKEEKVLTTSITFPGPPDGLTPVITWYYWDGHSEHTEVILSKNSSGNLVMTRQKNKNNPAQFFNHWTYFCYNTNPNRNP